MEYVTEIWTLLVNYNSYFMVISAAGFLLSLMGYIFSENKKRAQAEIKANLSQEKAFFGHFEEIENPAFKIPDFSIGYKTDSDSNQNTMPEDVPLTNPVNSDSKPSVVEKPKFLEELEKEIKAVLPDLPVDASPIVEPEIEMKDVAKPTQEKTPPMPPLPPPADEKVQVVKATEGNSIPQNKLETDTYEYDDEEKKVKSLLEQIKKDMREQGDHTS